jgi:hypothetical protein
MSEVATPEVPLDVLGREIIACVQRIFRDQRKADDWRATARQKLIEAHKRTGGGAAFAGFLEPLCKQIEVVQDDSGIATTISIAYAYEIMGKTPEQSRADWRDQATRKRENARAPKSPDKPADSRTPGKQDRPLKTPKKSRSQPQLLAAFRKCVDAMTPATKRDALTYLNGSG